MKCDHDVGRTGRCKRCGVQVRRYKGNVVHLVPGSGGRWVIAWRIGDQWATTVHNYSAATWGRNTWPITAESLNGLVEHGAATYASAPGATKAARKLGIDPTVGAVR